MHGQQKKKTLYVDVFNSCMLGLFLYPFAVKILLYVVAQNETSYYSSNN